MHRPIQNSNHDTQPTKYNRFHYNTQCGHNMEKIGSPFITRCLQNSQAYSLWFTYTHIHLKALWAISSCHVLMHIFYPMCGHNVACIFACLGHRISCPEAENVIIAVSPEYGGCILVSQVLHNSRPRSCNSKYTSLISSRYRLLWFVCRLNKV